MSWKAKFIQTSWYIDNCDVYKLLSNQELHALFQAGFVNLSKSS